MWFQDWKHSARNPRIAGCLVYFLNWREKIAKMKQDWEDWRFDYRVDEKNIGIEKTLCRKSR